jgi:hypothetical protein
MSSMEERLARDIAAVTGSVVVTESDLRDARNAVEGRIDSQRQRDRRRFLVASAAAVVIPILGVVAFLAFGESEQTAQPVSPAPTGPAEPSPDADEEFLTGSAPTPEVLEGVWRVDNATTQLRFTLDGAVVFDDGARLFSDPGAFGTYAIAGDVITISVDGGSAGCAGQAIAMRASVAEPGVVHLVYTQPGTGGCAPERDFEKATGQAAWERVLPASGMYAEYLPSEDPDAAWEPSAGTTALHGIWWPEGGGDVLELSPDGTYHVATGSGEVVDRGRWALGDSRSQLSLVSADDSPTCTQGDRLVIGGLEHFKPGTIAMRGSVEQNTCAGAWAHEVWLLVPNKNTL